MVVCIYIYCNLIYVVVGGVKRKVYVVKGLAEGGYSACLSLPEEELSQ